jgi:hypothetical protein
VLSLCQPQKFKIKRIGTLSISEKQNIFCFEDCKQSLMTCFIIKMKLTKHISILFVLLATSMASAQVKFDSSTTKKKVGLNEFFVVAFAFNVDPDNFTPPNFEDFVLMNNWDSISHDSLETKNNEYIKTIYYRIVPKKAGKFLIEEARLIHNKNLYRTKALEIEVLKEDFYEPEDEETIDAKFNNGIHLVAEVSNTKITTNDSIIISYKLYVSPDIGVSNWKLIKTPDYKGFKVNFINQKTLKLKYETFNKKKYRSVILNKVILRPRERGTFNLSALTISIKAEIPIKGNDKLRNDIKMEKITRSIKSNQLIINVN